MKNIILFSAYLAIITSCSFVNDKADVSKKLNEVEYKSMVDTLKQTKIKDTASNTYQKNNAKVDFKTIGNLDVMMHDIGFYNSKQAEIECEKLGDGWRLPNEAEMTLIYEQSNTLGEFSTNYYVGLGFDEEEKVYLRLSIINGEIVLLQSDQEVYSVYGLRAVRDHIH
jgi:hypothetical protein